MESLLVERPPELPGLTIVTLNRPAKLNAITPLMHEELQQLCLGLQTDTETWVVVLTGAGRAFSAGADISGWQGQASCDAPLSSPLSTQSELEQRLRVGMGNRTCALLERMEQVTICAIHGLAVGGAVSIAASLDIRLGAESVWFSIPEAELGIPIAWNALERLIRELGPARTRELVMTGDRFSSKDGFRWRFINHVVPDEELMPPRWHWRRSDWQAAACAGAPEELDERPSADDGARAGCAPRPGPAALGAAPARRAEHHGVVRPQQVLHDTEPGITRSGRSASCSSR